MMASSIDAGWQKPPHHPWNHRPQWHRPASASNSNVNINTNKNDNTNNLISSLLSQLTSDQQNTQCVYGDVSCYEKLLEAAGPAKSQEPTQENDEDAAAPEDENEEILSVEKTSDNSKRYRPQASRASNSNFNSNSNSNSNNDWSSLYASLQQLLINQKKVAAKEAPVAA
jgi:hypothetical protein